MKRLVLFALAFGVGSLAVVGQDDGADDGGLRARIDALEAELSARLKEKAGRAELRVTGRMYALGDLCGPVLDEDLVPTHLRPSAYVAPEREAHEPAAPYHVDQIIELIRQTVHPASWDTIEGADMQPKGDRLYVHTVPAVHDGIAVLLAQLRRYLAPQIAVRVTAVPVEDGTAALLRTRPRAVTAEEERTLAALEPLGSARVVCADGQQVVQRNGAQRGYLADYDVAIAESAALGAPVRASVFEGCNVQVRATLDREGEGAVLHLVLERSRLSSPTRAVETDHGPLDLPELQLTNVQTSLWAPLGKTVVVGGGDHCVFLIRADRVAAK